MELSLPTVSPSEREFLTALKYPQRRLLATQRAKTVALLLVGVGPYIYTLSNVPNLSVTNKFLSFLSIEPRFGFPVCLDLYPTFKTVLLTIL